MESKTFSLSALFLVVGAAASITAGFLIWQNTRRRTLHLLKNRAEVLAGEIAQGISPEAIDTIHHREDEKRKDYKDVINRIRGAVERNPELVKGAYVYRLLSGQRAEYVVAPLFSAGETIPPGTPYKRYLNDQMVGAVEDRFVAVRHVPEGAGGSEEIWAYVPLLKKGKPNAGLAVKMVPRRAEQTRMGDLMLSAGIALGGLFLTGACVFYFGRAKKYELENRKFRHREQAYEDLASSDPLTGVGNRRMLLKTLDQAIEKQKEKDATPFCVALFNIDHFKPVNDRLGSSTGDTVLSALARLIRENKRDGDRVCRFASDEFAVYMPDTPLEDARKVIHDLHHEIDSNLASEAGIAREFPRLGTTVGIVQYDSKLRHTDKFLHQLSKAVQLSKNSSRGRGRTQIFKKSDLAGGLFG